MFQVSFYDESENSVGTWSSHETLDEAIAEYNKMCSYFCKTWIEKDYGNARSQIVYPV